MANKTTTPCHFLMAFRDEQGQQAAIVGNESETLFGAYWPAGRIRHRSLGRCIAALEALGFVVEPDVFIS